MYYGKGQVKYKLGFQRLNELIMNEFLECAESGDINVDPEYFEDPPYLDSESEYYTVFLKYV